jgi:hypothetical protein
MSDPISDSKLHRLYVTTDKYDYAMAMAGCCERLGWMRGCGCAEECSLVKMHLKWEEENGNR